MNQLNEDKRTLILYLLSSGESMRHAARLAGVHKNTVASLAKGVIDDCDRPPRGPGRPPLPEGKGKDKIVPVRFTESEHQSLCEHAKDRGFKSLSAWIRSTLTKEAKNGNH